MTNPYQPQDNQALFNDIGPAPAPNPYPPVPEPYPPVPDPYGPHNPAPQPQPPAPQPQYNPVPQQQAPQPHQAQYQEPVYTISQSQLEQIIDQTTARVQTNLNQTPITDRLIPEPPPLQPEPDNTGRSKDMKDLMWDNPEEFARTIQKETLEQVKNQQQAQQNIDNFWNGFYTQNPDLNRTQDHGLVTQVLSQNMASLGSLPLNTLMPQLAQMVRAQLSAYATRFTGQPAPQIQPASPFVGESPNPVSQVPGTPPAPAPAPLNPPNSIVGLLKAKQNARANRRR